MLGLFEIDWTEFCEHDPQYEKVLILDDTNSTIRSGHVFPNESMATLYEAELCFHVMANGGV